MELGDGDIVYRDANSVLLRNRVYIIIDSLNQVALNGHLLSMSEFQKGLNYVCNNPDQLEHLPMHPDSVVLCINYDLSSMITPSEVEKAFKMQYVFHCIEGLKYHGISHYLQEKGKSWQTANASDLQAIPENFANRFKMALPISSPDDKGISVKLPPWSEEEPDITKLKTRNVLKITVDAQNKIYVNGKETKVEDLTARAKAFIANPEGHPDLAESPRKAIVSLKNERGTNYKEYLEAYNALKTAYYELWDELSQRKYGVPYSDDMPYNQKRAIREEIPFVLSESEPTAFGEE